MCTIKDNKYVYLCLYTIFFISLKSIWIHFFSLLSIEINMFKRMELKAWLNKDKMINDLFLYNNAMNDRQKKKRKNGQRLRMVFGLVATDHFTSKGNIISPYLFISGGSEIYPISRTRSAMKPRFFLDISF